MTGTSNIDSDLLSDLHTPPYNAFHVCQLDIGSSNNVLRSHTHAHSATDGYYEGRVTGGTITRKLSTDGTLPSDQASILLQDDASRTLEKLLYGTARSSVIGVGARVLLASTERAASKWFTVFKGIIASFSSEGPRKWRFQLKRDDRALRSLCKIPYIVDYDWPNALPSEIGKPAHVIYGTHSSVNTGESGMVRAFYVDTSNYRYVASYGILESIDAVYIDGTLKTLTTDYTVDLTYYHNGRYWSVITFTSDQGTTESANLCTFDCHGLTDSGEIKNIATQIEHFLANFALGNWGDNTSIRDSSWITPSSLDISTSHIDTVEQFFVDKQIAKAGRVISADRRALDVVQEACNQGGIDIFYTYDGKIALSVDDHTITDHYISAPFFRQDRSPKRDSIKAISNSDLLLDEVSTEYAFASASGKFARQLTVKDSSKGYGVTLSRPLHWRESDLS